MTLTCGSCGHPQEFVKGDHAVPYGDEPEWDVVKVWSRESRRLVKTKIARCCKCGYRTWRDENQDHTRVMTVSDEAINDVDLYAITDQLFDPARLQKVLQESPVSFVLNYKDRVSPVHSINATKDGKPNTYFDGMTGRYKKPEP